LPSFSAEGSTAGFLCRRSRGTWTSRGKPCSTSFWHALDRRNNDRIFDKCRGHAFSLQRQAKIRPMIEAIPLAKAVEAYEHMMRNEARFRIVLAMGQ